MVGFEKIVMNGRGDAIAMPRDARRRQAPVRNTRGSILKAAESVSF